VAESEREQDQIQREYSDVFGNTIEFFEHKLMPEEYRMIKKQALIRMLHSLRN
jgi:hypothetical protein